jgi:excisionase family DNA binding protein
MLMTVEQAAKELQCSEEHLRRLIRARRIPIYQLSPKLTRLDMEEVRHIARRPQPRNTGDTLL